MGGQQQQVQPGDWERILFGQEPAAYFLELLLRAAVAYLILIFAMRLLGKRMSSQLSRTEMAAMVSLAAAIGVPLLSSDRGLVPAIAVAIVVVVIGRTVATLSRKSGTVETAAQGTFSILVKDGTLNVHEMQRARVTRERVFAQLRSCGLHQLGAVQRLYLEAAGAFTYVRSANPPPGLSLIPDWDADFIRELTARADHTVCGNCGLVKRAGSNDGTCPNCGERRWVPAVE